MWRPDINKKTHFLMDFSEHPMNTASAVWWIIFGIISFLEGYTKTLFTQSVISLFSESIAILIGGGWFLSGIFLTWSLYTNVSKLEIVYQWRKLAYTLAIFSGFVYAYQTTLVHPLAVMEISFGLFNLTLGLFGLLAVIVTEQNKRDVIRKDGNPV